MKAKKQNEAIDIEYKIERLDPDFLDKIGWGKEPIDLTPVKIRVSFDSQLSKIVGTQQTTAIVSNGHSFMLFFSFLLQDYPTIKEKYPPGQLGFTLNGEPPANDAKLRDGDRLYFMVTQ